MKKLAFVVAALALALPGAAQEQQQTRTNIGLGVSVNPEAALSPTYELYLPIGIGPSLRVEPSIGIFTQDADGADRSDLTLGVGVFALRSAGSAPLDMYFGGRLKLNFASEDNGIDDDSGTDISLAAALGGEYYFVPKFSIGLEGQLGFYSLSDVGGDLSGFFTTGLGFLRMYF